MRFFVKLLIVVVVIAVLLPFTFIKGKDGKPLMSLHKLKMPSLSLPQVPDTLKGAGIQGSASGKDLIYKWKDAKGVLHFSSSPPPGGIKYSVKGYDPNTNLIQSVEVEKDKPEPMAPPPDIKKPSDLVNVYSPDKIEKLIKDAKNVQNLLNERVKKQQAILGDN